MTGQEETAARWAREVQVGHQKEELEQAAQGSDGVTIPGNIQGKTGCGTYSHGLVYKVVQSKVRLNHFGALS